MESQAPYPAIDPEDLLQHYVLKLQGAVRAWTDDFDHSEHPIDILARMRADPEYAYGLLSDISSTALLIRLKTFAEPTEEPRPGECPT